MNTITVRAELVEARERTAISSFDRLRTNGEV
jgi:hypothetical protein